MHRPLEPTRFLLQFFDRMNRIHRITGGGENHREGSKITKCFAKRSAGILPVFLLSLSAFCRLPPATCHFFTLIATTPAAIPRCVVANFAGNMMDCCSSRHARSGATKNPFLHPVRTCIVSESGLTFGKRCENVNEPCLTPFLLPKTHDDPDSCQDLSPDPYCPRIPHNRIGKPARCSFLLQFIEIQPFDRQQLA